MQVFGHRASACTRTGRVQCHTAKYWLGELIELKFAIQLYNVKSMFSSARSGRKWKEILNSKYFFGILKLIKSKNKKHIFLHILHKIQTQQVFLQLSVEFCKVII